MEKTLVIILSETRASELTFANFKENVIDKLNADLCVCIGVKPDYDYTNPYYKLAKYKFTYEEPEDYAVAFDFAYTELSKDRPSHEHLPNTNALYGKLPTPQTSSKEITYYGKNPDIKTIPDSTIVVHENTFPDPLWQNQVYGIKSSSDSPFISQENVTTYVKPLPWRNFLKIKNQFLGGIKDETDQHPGSAGILIFFRWFLLKNLIDAELINKYDRFIITRSDFMYQLPHPPLNLLNPKFIWVPNSEQYGGYTDRHVIVSNKNIESYLNILNNLVLRSNEFYTKLSHHTEWNLEQIIKFNIEQNNVGHLVKEFPYIMYSVRNINGSTRWSGGAFSEKLGYYVKYASEFEISSKYRADFLKKKCSIDEFYRNSITI